MVLSIRLWLHPDPGGQRRTGSFLEPTLETGSTISLLGRVWGWETLAWLQYRHIRHQVAQLRCSEFCFAFLFLLKCQPPLTPAAENAGLCPVYPMTCGDSIGRCAFETILLCF